MPLSGVRVLDLTRLAPGPYATRVLAELGAAVVKIEPPEGGDYTRWMPPLCGDPPASGMFRELNRGKKSVALDLKRPEAQAALRALSARSDVLVDGFRPGVLSRLGLDPAALMEANPRLIYCAITGFGLTGPDAQRAGHDIGYMARAGTLGLTGSADRPVSLGIQVADFGAGLVAVAGICAALYERERTGQGRVVDVSLVESALAFNALNLGAMLAGAIPKRGREVLDGSRPCYSIYRTGDGKFLAVGALEPKFWLMFVNALGLPDLGPYGLDDGEDGAAARERVQARLQEKSRDEWMDVFRTVDCCVEPILDPDEVPTDPHLRARHITAVDGTTRSPIRVAPWPDHPGHPRALPASPALGQHTREVLEEAGLPSDLISALT